MDFAARDEFHEEIMRALGKVNNAALREILQTLGDPPDVSQLTPEIWESITKEFYDAVVPELEAIYFEQAQAYADSIGFGFDSTIVNRAASEWARNYGQQLTTQWGDVRFERIGESVGRFFEESWSLGELREAIVNLGFNPNSADTIAMTEITRAAAQGEVFVADLLRAEGVRFRVIWRTNEDGLVCPICGPLNGTEQGTDWLDPPPRHARCRCWITHEPIIE